mmetsp:Transcript_28039/g.84303  ORF Transcript_28039/g.84303 Transcript_28039/m.84303 type:complete len:385 (-) Transcript_28039:176-1330(-)
MTSVRSTDTEHHHVRPTGSATTVDHRHGPLRPRTHPVCHMVNFMIPGLHSQSFSLHWHAQSGPACPGLKCPGLHALLSLGDGPSTRSRTAAARTADGRRARQCPRSIGRWARPPAPVCAPAARPARERAPASRTRLCGRRCRTGGSSSIVRTCRKPGALVARLCGACVCQVLKGLRLNPPHLSFLAPPPCSWTLTTRARLSRVRSSPCCSRCSVKCNSARFAVSPSLAGRRPEAQVRPTLSWRARATIDDCPPSAGSRRWRRRRSTRATARTRSAGPRWKCSGGRCAARRRRRRLTRRRRARAPWTARSWAGARGTCSTRRPRTIRTRPTPPRARARRASSRASRRRTRASTAATILKTRSPRRRRRSGAARPSRSGSAASTTS